jgi:hypothetical protein
MASYFREKRCDARKEDKRGFGSMERSGSLDSHRLVELSWLGTQTQDT